MNRKILQLQCFSFLPAVSPGEAEALTGLAESAHLPDDMRRNSFFTDRHRELEYRYHPLFREFLQFVAFYCIFDDPGNS